MPPLSTHVALRVYYFVAFGAIGLYLPYFPPWLAARGFVGWQMSAIMALFPLCQLLSPTLVGMLADKLGLRGKMMTLCAASSALGLTLFGLLSLAFDPLPFALAFGSMFAFTALRSPTIGLADVLSIELAPNYSRMRLWGSLGFFTCSLSGGYLIDGTHRWHLPLAIAACMWMLTLVSLFLPKNSRMPPRPALIDAKLLLRKVAYRRLLLTMMLIFGSFSAYDLCSSLRLKELGATGPYVGQFWAIATLCEVALLYFADRVLVYFGPGKVLTFACLVSVGRWLFFSQEDSLELILWLQPLHAISFGLMWVSAMGVLKREVGMQGTGTAQGLYASAVAVGATLGLASWGIVFERFGSSRVFTIAAGIMACAALLASRLIQLTRPGVGGSVETETIKKAA